MKQIWRNPDWLQFWNVTLPTCSWDFVQCDPQNLTIVQLEIFGLPLAGNIPSVMGNLTGLEQLYMSGCGLYGNIPSSMGNITSLTYLHIPENALNGSISSSIGNMTNLNHLSLEHNALTGHIPESVGSIMNLRYLYLNENDLEGFIPETLGALNNLEELQLEGNRLSGSMPSSFINLTSLKYLHLDRIFLNGSLPFSLGKLVNLSYVDLSNNGNLSGSFEESFRNMSSSLAYLNISNNIISGEIPHSFWNNTSIYTLDLSLNELEGTLPYNIASFSNMYALWLDDNKLSGDLPDLSNFGHSVSWFNLSIHLGNNDFTGNISTNVGLLGTSLSFLSLRGNLLSGSVPDSLGNCTGLILLDISDNEIGGVLPTSLESTTFPSLRVFMVDSNILEGVFPTWITQSPLLQILDLSDNNFHGILPENFSALVGYINATNSSQGTLYQESIVLSPLGIPLKYILSARTSFDISHNKFEGRIPNQLGDLKGLVYLIMSTNNFDGAIPPKFGDLVNLEVLNVSNNQLFGSIPSTFSSLRFLAKFDVSGNNLSGPIPIGGQLNTFSISSFKPGNPYLCGGPLHACYNTTPEFTPPPFNGEEAQESEGIVEWVSFLALGVGFVTGFLPVCLVFLLNQKAISFISKPRRPKYRYNRPYGAYVPRS